MLDAKTKKGVEFGYLTGILYLAPATLSGKEVCPSRSPGCTAGCLNLSGRGFMHSVQAARLRKTKLFHEDRKLFLDMLDVDLALLRLEAHKMGLQPAVRLNGTSDIAWETIAPHLFVTNLDIQFYDYTKVVPRMHKRIRGEFPRNYSLTFSRSETNHLDSLDLLYRGENVAIVYNEVPTQDFGYEVVDGDKHDLRFLDGRNVIVGLKAKGLARKDNTGFVL